MYWGSGRLHPKPHHPGAPLSHQRYRKDCILNHIDTPLSPYDHHYLLLLTMLSSSSGEINKALVVLGGEEEGHLKKVEDLKVSPSFSTKVSAAVLGKSPSAPEPVCRVLA